MNALYALFTLIFLAVSVLPACKKDTSSATFSQGNKRRSVRKTDSIDRSKSADIASAAPPNATTRGSFTVWTVPRDPAPGQSYQVFIEVKLPPSVGDYQQSDLRGKVIGTDGYEQIFGEDGAECNGAQEFGGTEGGISGVPDENFESPKGSSSPSNVVTGGNGQQGGGISSSSSKSGGGGQGGSTTGGNAEGFGLKGHSTNKGLNLAGCGGGFEDFNFGKGRGRLSVWVPGGGDKVRDTIDVTSRVLNEHQTIAIEF